MLNDLALFCLFEKCVHPSKVEDLCKQNLDFLYSDGTERSMRETLRGFGAGLRRQEEWS